MATQCPMRNSSTPTCPMRNASNDVNPLNNMPDLPQSWAPNQLKPLPTERVTSTIPRPPEATYGGQPELAAGNLLLSLHISHLLIDMIKN